MYFDFEDDRPDTPTIPSPLSAREGVLVSIIFHLLIVILILIAPSLPFVKAMEERRQQALEEQQRLELERQRENARFVFVQPRLDIPAPPPPRADLSDIDRRARTVERAPNPTNPLPFARGNQAERIEAEPTREMRGAETPPQPQPAETNGTSALKPPMSEAPPTSSDGAPRGPAAGVIADAIRNVQKYAQKDGYGNLRGGMDQEPAPSIQFDTKGVEFGPWLRRFVAQIRRNWNIPYAAMTMHGHVVVTFYVHKDGRITDVTVAKPSTVSGFTASAANAILASNPTVALPPEYPDDKAFFTVTFYFNETPPGR